MRSFFLKKFSQQKYHKHNISNGLYILFTEKMININKYIIAYKFCKDNNNIKRGKRAYSRENQISKSPLIFINLFDSTAIWVTLPLYLIKKKQPSNYPVSA